MMDAENQNPQLQPTGGKAGGKGLGVKKAAAPGGRSIEEMYQKKSQLEHILLRPDTYGETPYTDDEFKSDASFSRVGGEADAADVGARPGLQADGLPPVYIRNPPVHILLFSA